MGKSHTVRINVPKKQLGTAAQTALANLVGQSMKNHIATKIFLEMCEPYVPIGSGEPPEYYQGRKQTAVPDSGGRLRASGRATEKTVVWGEGLPYARYVYEGIIYGPNIPITGINWETGETMIRGWFSPPGEKKYPTGRYMSYYEWKPERHWDEAMIRDNRRLYNYRVTVALRQLAKKRGKL